MITAVAVPVVVAFLVAAGVLAGSALTPGRRRSALVPLAVGAGYAAGHAVLGWPALPPVDAVDWTAWLASCGAVAGALGSFGPPWAGRATAGILCTAAPVLVLRPILAAGPEAPWAWIALWILSFPLAGAGLAALGARSRGTHLAVVLWIVGSGTSAALLVSGSLRLAQLAGAMAAALGAAAALAVFRPSIPSGWVAIVVVPVLGGLIVAGRFYSELPTASAVLLGLAPLAAWPAASGMQEGPAGWKSISARGLIALLVASVAAAIAWGASPPIEPYQM